MSVFRMCGPGIDLVPCAAWLVWVCQCCVLKEVWALRTHVDPLPGAPSPSSACESGVKGGL